MACLTITGAIKSTPTAAIEMLLNLTPPDLLIMAEVKMTLYRLHILMQPADYNSSWDAIHLEKCERPHLGYAVRSHYSSLSLLQNLQGHY